MTGVIGSLLLILLLAAAFPGLGRATAGTGYVTRAFGAPATATTEVATRTTRAAHGYDHVGTLSSAPQVVEPRSSATEDTETVGRYMSQDELDAMRDEGRVQQGGGGRTYVYRPADPQV